MALTIHINTGTSDLQLNQTGAEFTEFSEGNDQLVFSAGSTEVDDGQPVPTQSELISAGVILTGSQIIVDRYFLSDISANLLKESFNMGNQNKRYVLAFDFDAATASEPVFEVWDDDTFDSIDDTFLGAGTPSSSFVRAVTTTTTSPGSGWATLGGTTRLAGAGSGNFLFLNDENGPLTGADTLYANLAIVIPASQTTGFSSNVVFVCKYLSN